MLRDPSIAESAKQRSLRVPLDYAQRPDSLTRRKVIYVCVALAIAATYALWLAGGSRGANRQLSPGPLSNAHATWNDDCQACHVPTQALRSDSVNLLGRLTSRTHPESGTPAANVLCLDCHQPLHHHSSVKLEDELNCSACHREHRGASHDVARAGDASCLRCHANLPAYNVQVAPIFANVTGFALRAGDKQPHPYFRSLQSDPGNIKFNHWLHLQPGIAPLDSRRALRVVDLPAEQQPVFAANQTNEGLVKLDCASCHEPAGDGRTMRPIAYQQHCAGCHPLDTRVTAGESVALPHGLPADQLQPILDGLLLESKRQAAPPQSSAVDESGKLPLIPGKTLGNNLAQKLQQDLLIERTKLAAGVAAKCLQCHEPQSAEPNQGMLLPEWKPSKIPNPWFIHARFDHQAHRHVDCKDCHREAYSYQKIDQPRFLQPDPAAANTLTARDSQEVMIAGIESCTNCHAPKRDNLGGARHDCAECHTYHGSKVGPGRRTGPELQVDAHPAIDLPFPGSLLGTHQREAPASRALAQPPTIRFAAFTAPSPQVGSASCASANCHGSTNPQAPAWQTAFTTWLAHDPHAQAFNVLFTQRSREMTRRLSGSTVELDERQHIRALAAHCTDCHGNPSATEGLTNLGVECESCHGPAKAWLHTHTRTGFARNTPGFNDTKNLDTRAQTCLRCHVSHPPSEQGTQHVVHHDLIASGHPRLTFDLRTYQESLPAHWDRRADASRHAPAFHFQTWLTGLQQAQSIQAKSIDQPPDFAQLDCFGCHHSLRAAGSRQPAKLDKLVPPNWPPHNLLQLSSAHSLADRVTLASRLLAAAQTEQRYDAAIHALQCVQAIRADLTSRGHPAFDRAIAALQHYLARECFPVELTRTRQPSAYDAPSEFDPQALKPHLDAVLHSLQQVESP